METKKQLCLGNDEGEAHNAAVSWILTGCSHHTKNVTRLSYSILHSDLLRRFSLLCPVSLTSLEKVSVA